jgi:hypothetical protein
MYGFYMICVVQQGVGVGFLDPDRITNGGQLVQQRRNEWGTGNQGWSVMEECRR